MELKSTGVGQDKVIDALLAEMGKAAPQGKIKELLFALVPLAAGVEGEVDDLGEQDQIITKRAIVTPPPRSLSE